MPFMLLSPKIEQPSNDYSLIWRRFPSRIEQPWTWSSPKPEASFDGWNDSHPDRRRHSPNSGDGCQNISNRHFESKNQSQYLSLNGLDSESDSGGKSRLPR